LESRRSIAERIAFSRTNVISGKIFGGEIPNRWWKQAERQLSDWVDDIHGTVLLARKTSAPAHYIFVEAPAPAQRNEQVLHAAAAVLFDRQGKTVMVKRGELGPLVRDFANTWSLPSSMARTGKTLTEGLRESLLKNLGVNVSHLAPLAVRICRRYRPEQQLFVMSLFEGMVHGKIETKTAKYADLRWCTPSQVLNAEVGPQGCGACITCYQDVLRCGWRAAGSRLCE
jgi:ADP-ribose pyrophosphatase YjhB (NUDIX family)